jgi:hypothetical protein
MGVQILPQMAEQLSEHTSGPTIQPDIVVALEGRTAAIVDSKYKRDTSGPQNGDIFQVIAYGTALACNDTYLFYPETELAMEKAIAVRNSSIVVNTRRVVISGEECVKSAESCVRLVLEHAVARFGAMLDDSQVRGTRIQLIPVVGKEGH